MKTPKNAKQQKRRAARDMAIWSEFRRLEARRLQPSYIFELLGDKFFLSERTLRDIIRERSQAKQPA